MGRRSGDAPGRHAGPLDGHPALSVEVAQQALQLPEAVLVEGVQVEAGVGPASGPGHLGPEPLDELLLLVVARRGPGPDVFQKRGFSVSADSLGRELGTEEEPRQPQDVSTAIAQRRETRRPRRRARRRSGSQEAASPRIPPSVMPRALKAMASSTVPALAAMTPPTSIRKLPAATTMPAKIFLIGAGIA